MKMYSSDVKIDKVDSVLKALIRQSKRGDTIATLAARHDQLELLKLCKSSELELANLDSKRPLHEAAQAGNAECVKYLLSRHVVVDCLKRSDWTPLMLACTKENRCIVEDLLGAGADPTLKNKDGWNSLHVAAREGFSDIINALLDHDSTLWSTSSKNGRTPLHTAALHGRVKAVGILLTRGRYEKDARDGCGTTPLMDSLRSGHIDVAQMLIQRHRADVRAEDVLGRQSLHLAAQSGSSSSIRYLVETCRVDVNTPTSTSSDTPLHSAAKEGQVEAVTLLISLGADTGALNDRGRTAFDVACAASRGDCVVKLLGG